tara:strand:+ start:1002 stop:1331 length:330 start_codon:yes stop_codon:yes gene_type:complete
MNNPLKIALDFDETYTADPEMWDLFVYLSQQRNHNVTFVTYRDSRYENADIRTAAAKLGIEIVFTGGKQKQHCYDADIWIDDSPETIVNFETLGEMYDGCLANGDCNEL